MHAAFNLNPALRALAKPETIFCRCEDVAYGDVAAHTSWRDAKLQTRCGMGPCQGKICGGAAAFCFGWGPRDGDRGSQHPPDRKSVAEGQSVDVRVGLGGRRYIKKKK